MKTMTLATLACLSLAACKTEATADPLDLLGLDAEWHVTEIAGDAVPETVRVTLLRPEPGMIAGNSGCNRYTGPARTVDGRIEIGALAGTRMMCPDAQMQAETAFHSTIGKTRGARITDDVLEFTDNEGAVILRARK